MTTNNTTNINNSQLRDINNNSNINSNNQFITIEQLHQIKDEIKKESKFWCWISVVTSSAVSGIIVLVMEKLFFK